MIIRIVEFKSLAPYDLTVLQRNLAIQQGFCHRELESMLGSSYHARLRILPGYTSRETDRLLCNNRSLVELFVYEVHSKGCMIDLPSLKRIKCVLVCEISILSPPSEGLIHPTRMNINCFLYRQSEHIFHPTG